MTTNLTLPPTPPLILEILGCGGAVSVPRPFCRCVPCQQAREYGAPYTRYCPSIFIHGLNVLIDTGEESLIQLNRAGIERVDHVVYSHWHPDHTAGIRVFEANYDPERTWRRDANRCTEVWLPQNVADTFGKYHALSEKVGYLEKFGLLHTNVIPAGQSFTIEANGYCATITPFVLWEDLACGYLFEVGRARFVICMDEVFNWTPPTWLGELDFIVIPGGIFDVHPLTGEQVIPVDHALLSREATHTQIVAALRHVRADRAIFFHLNESDNLTLEEYREVAARLNAKRQELGLPEVRFAYDGLKVDIEV